MGNFWRNFLEKPWRVFDWRAKDELLSYSRAYKPDGAKHLRIQLSGPVGAGKSSFINSVASLILGKPVSLAEPNARKQDESFTIQNRVYEVKYQEGNPIFLTDIVGLEAGKNGIRPEDIILTMKGHVKDKYTFNPHCALSEDNDKYRKNPSIDDKVHVLVWVLDANSTEIDPSILDKMTTVRKAARDLGIPQVAIATHIDEICDAIEDDITMVFRSRVLKTTMEELSVSVGIPIHNIFPVWNNYEREKKDEAATLILTVLKIMLDFGNGSIQTTNPIAKKN